MAAPTTTDAWDEYLLSVATGDITPADSWNVGLYDDGTDTITSSDDIGAVTTEPSGSGYATKTVTPSADTTLSVGADTTVDIVDQTWSGLDFGTETAVNAFYVSLATVLDGDGSQTEHLMFVGSLTDGPFDLSNYSEFTAQDMGVTQTQG